MDRSDRYLNIKGRIYAAQQKWDEAEAAFKKAIAVDDEKFNNYQTLLALFQSRKEMDKAKELLDQMVERFPDLAQVHLMRANFYQAQNDKEQVEAELLKAVEIEPDNVQYRLVLANFYNNTGDQDQAEAALIKARSDIPDDPDIETALATLYFEERQFDKSQELLGKILEAQSDHKAAKLLQIRFALKDGKNRDSIAPLEKLNRDSPNWSDPYFYLGLAHFNLGELERAQQAVVKAIQINKNDNKYRTLIAQIYQMQGQFEAARKEASIALQLNPKNFRAALILGRSLVSDKQFDDAIKLFSEMEKQVQGNPEVLSNLALAYLGAKDRENAEKTLNGLLEVSPGNYRAVSLLIALKYQDDLAGAEGFVKKQLEVAPDSSGLHVLLGEILVRQQKDEEALAAFEKAQELAPENSQAYVAAGRLLVRLGRKDEAMAKYEAMLTQQPNSIVGLMGIATLLDADGRAAEAMEQYKKILAIKGDYAPAANNLAWQIASSADGDLGEALRYAMMAKQALPEEPHIADTLGWVHYKRKSYSLAIPQFEMALSGRPEDPVISYHLALALKENGQNEKALAILEPIMANNNDFADRDGAATLLEELKSN